MIPNPLSRSQTVPQIPWRAPPRERRRTRPGLSSTGRRACFLPGISAAETGSGRFCEIGGIGTRRYVYGKSRRQITLDATGRRKRQTRKLPRSEWSVLIPEHHTGFIDWATYEANRSRIAANTHPQPHHSGGAVREGSALLQGLATCGACGRRLRTHYTGHTASPGYHCAGRRLFLSPGSREPPCTSPAIKQAAEAGGSIMSIVANEGRASTRQPRRLLFARTRTKVGKKQVAEADG
jgi:hypothetical protein